jgi:hypothetical protein
MNWIKDKIESRVIADAQLYYAGWLAKQQSKTKVV